ncbi:MAG: hypothetical protein WAX89_04995 [Alphaproteobacteria bacterium]
MVRRRFPAIAAAAAGVACAAFGNMAAAQTRAVTPEDLAKKTAEIEKFLAQERIRNFAAPALARAHAVVPPLPVRKPAPDGLRGQDTQPRPNTAAPLVVEPPVATPPSVGLDIGAVGGGKCIEKDGCDLPEPICREDWDNNDPRCSSNFSGGTVPVAKGKAVATKPVFATPRADNTSGLVGAIMGLFGKKAETPPPSTKPKSTKPLER